MTSDMSNMVVKSSYLGSSKVQVGNEESLPVTHTCMMLLPYFESHGIVHLKDILCVPKIAKNLLSISQITKDTNVTIEFYYDHCLVKDRSSKVLLLQGIVKNGFY